MSIEDSIDNSVYIIRHAVQSIRDSIDTSEIDSDLDSIENECDELLNLKRMTRMTSSVTHWMTWGSKTSGNSGAV